MVESFLLVPIQVFGRSHFSVSVSRIEIWRTTHNSGCTSRGDQQRLGEQNIADELTMTNNGGIKRMSTFHKILFLLSRILSPVFAISDRAPFLQFLILNEGGRIRRHSLLEVNGVVLVHVQEIE